MKTDLYRQFLKFISSTVQANVHFHFCRQKRARKAMEQFPKTTKQIVQLEEQRRDTWWQIFD